MKPITDVKKFESAKTTASRLYTAGATRNQQFDKSEDLYFLKWKSAPTPSENYQITISPDGRDKAQGIVRLLSASEPIITVSRDGLDKSEAGHIENALSQMWSFSSRTAGTDVHYDAALSAVLYSTCHLTCLLTSELVKYAKGTSPANVRRVEALAEKTPVLFRAISPRNGYVDWDDLGMCVFYSKTKTTVGNVKRLHGKPAEIIKGEDTDSINLNDYWDLTYHYVWVDGTEKPLLSEEHELPFIPVSVAVAEGSRLFVEEEKKIQPFLYGLYESGVWDRQNLSLTTLYTKLAQFGSMPPVIIENSPSGDTVTMDYTNPIPIWYTPPGAKVNPTGLNMIDPNLYRAMEIANGLAEASTIYNQTLGAPLGGGAAFSTVALLSQAGRLPIIGSQKAVSRATGDIMQLALEWCGSEGAKHELLKDIDLSQRYEVSVKLDVKLPQDLVKNAGVAMQMTSPNNPMVSKSWALENLLQITDPDEQRRIIGMETAYAARFAQKMQQMLQPPQPQMPPTAPQQKGQSPMPQGAPAMDGSMQMPLDANTQAGSPQGVAGEPSVINGTQNISGAPAETMGGA